MLRGFKGGEALFTMPPVPIKCAGAPQKIVYLADEIFRKNGVRQKTHLHFLLAGKVIFGVPEFAKPLLQVIQRKGIAVEYGHRLVGVKPKQKRAVFEAISENGPVQVEKEYDLLHIVPPMRAHAFIGESGLAYVDGPQAGWLEVDKGTLQHRRFSSIFGIGDVTGVPNSKTGAAIRKQAPVVAANALEVLKGKTPTAQYNGYSSCPLVTGVGKVILAEFGYDGKLLPSFPLDPTRERRTMWWLKRYLLAPLYWRGMLAGRF
jgi:sulfide:quinone oxidoreductase